MRTFLIAGKFEPPADWLEGLPLCELLPKLRRIVRRWESREFVAERRTLAPRSGFTKRGWHMCVDYTNGGQQKLRIC